MTSYFSLDGLRAILVLGFAVGQAVAAYWPELRQWPHTIASRSARLRNPVVPINWAFAIWGPIFLSCIAFAVWQALPGNLDDLLARRIGWLALPVFAGTVAWEAYVPRRDLDGVSVAIILVELGLLLTILLILAGAPRPVDLVRFWLVHVPFQVLAGWVSVATFVNTASALQRAGVAMGTRLSLPMIAGAAALGSVVAWTTGGWFYAAAVAWALFGVVVANTARDRRPAVAAVAGGLIPVLLACVALSGAR